MNRDSQIIAQLEQRDEQALTEIRRIYGKLCFRIAQQMLGSAEDAEEMEVVIRCFSERDMRVYEGLVDKGE